MKLVIMSLSQFEGGKTEEQNKLIVFSFCPFNVLFLI